MWSNFRRQPHFLYLTERGDQALSNGGKDNPVRCLERRQIAVENRFFSRKKPLTFENCFGENGLNDKSIGYLKIVSCMVALWMRFLH